MREMNSGIEGDILNRGTKLSVWGDEDDWFLGWRGHGSYWEIIGWWHLSSGARPLIGQKAPGWALIGPDWAAGERGTAGPGCAGQSLSVLGRAAAEAENVRIMRRNSEQSSAAQATVTQSYCVCGKSEFYALVCRKEPQKLDRRRLAGSPASLRALVNHWARIIWNNCNLTAVWCTPSHSLATHFKVG